MKARPVYRILFGTFALLAVLAAMPAAAQTFVTAPTTVTFKASFSPPTTINCTITFKGVLGLSSTITAATVTGAAACAATVVQNLPWPVVATSPPNPPNMLISGAKFQMPPPLGSCSPVNIPVVVTGSTLSAPAFVVLCP